jgi:hypothetical protein
VDATRNKAVAFGFVAIVFIALPLQRFASSPTFDTARAVDLVLVFGAGMMTAALIAARGSRSRPQ